ncbi:hypothetical protein F0Q45_19980 [Mycobacterium simiae]|uniref:Uncharacterized protein n=1 Tax=Mycobacterium simiae TaxID=1784 RepID=A0A5B1BKR1_MYCSI|nr:hypothetical protein [Mycobacterium simiae]KAA1248561.1 hypothetical protein F0Q45_19980 [Mycobacterium simiae]
MKQMLFQRGRTVTPGGHPGPAVTVVGRGDGLLVRTTDADGAYIEVFLPTVDVAHLVEMLADNPAAWGMRPR